MNQKVLVGFFIILAVVLGLPLLAQFAQQGEESGSGTAEQTSTRDSRPASGSAAAPDDQGAPPAPAPAAQPPLLNASNLANSSWQMQVSGMNVTVDLLPGGQAVAKGTPLGNINGSWRVSGDTLTVTASVMGQTRTQNAKIVGNQIMIDGQPATRVR